MTAALIPNAPAPGTPEWLRYMTGSKIAAVMRLSPYESAYSLWYRMAGVVGPEPESDLMRRGHYLEPGILAWMGDRHPELQVGARRSMWASTENPSYAVSPDGLGTDLSTGDVVVLEAKSALDKDVWGEELSDEIPVYYRCQVMWAMGILGLKRSIVGVLTSYLEFREYQVAFDQSEFDLLASAAAEFMASLAEHRPPDIDSHKATYEVIKAMHPQIDASVPVEVPAGIAVPYTRAKAAEKAAADDARLWTARLADHMGNAKTAQYAGATIATRQTRSGGNPFVQAVRNLEPLPLTLIQTTDTDMREAS